ncbi:hypothetical protein [Nocardia sp. NPDC005998]|uniref:hypothetical protein n=1 Tax=Nocardia sp. NPDC005998 TaxID=3156894 RepID=UPI00339F04AB
MANDGTPPSTPGDATSTANGAQSGSDGTFLDNAPDKNPSFTNPWDGLAAQGKSNTLTVSHGSATVCAGVAKEMLARVSQARSHVSDLFLNPTSTGYPPTGWRQSGADLAAAFNGQADHLDNCLAGHEHALQGMVDTFKQAGKAYNDTENANAAAFYAIAPWNDAMTTHSVLPAGEYLSAGDEAPLTSAEQWISSRHGDAYAYSHQLPGVVYDHGSVNRLHDDQYAKGVLSSMSTASQQMGAGFKPTRPWSSDNTYTPSVALEHGDAFTNDGFYTFYSTIDYWPVMQAGASWLWLAKELDEGFGALRGAFNAVLGGGSTDGTGVAWTGNGADAANQAIANYLKSAQDLTYCMGQVASRLAFTADWLNQFKIVLPTHPEPDEEFMNRWRERYDNVYSQGAKQSVANMPQMPLALAVTPTSTGKPTDPAAAAAAAAAAGSGFDQNTQDARKAVDDEFAKKLKDSGLDQYLADVKKNAAGDGHYGAATGGAVGGALGGSTGKEASAGQPTPWEQQILTKLDKLEAQAAQQQNSNYKVPTANPPGPLEQIAQPIQGRPTSPPDGQTQSGTGTAPGVTGNAGDPVYPANYNPYAAQQNQAELSALANIGQQVAGAFQQFTNLLAQEVQQLTPSIERALDAAAHHDMMDHDAQGPGGHDHAGPDEPPRAQARMFPRDGLLDDTPIAAAEQAVDTATGGTGAEDDATALADATAEPSVDA